MSKKWSIGDQVNADSLNKTGFGLLVAEQPTPNMTVLVTDGVSNIAGTTVKYPGGNSPSITAPATNPRISLVTLDSSGVIAFVNGTEAASPTPPAYPNDKLVLAEIFCRVGMTKITNADDGINGYVSLDARPVVMPLPTATSSSGAADAGKLVKTGANGQVDPSFLPSAVVVSMLYGSTFGDSSTRFDITKTGNTVRYTWDGTGTNPYISAADTPVGSTVVINGQNFSAANNLTAAITAVGSNYFEITNASGVAEVDKTLGTGSIRFKIIPPAGTRYGMAEGIGGGGGGGDYNTGSSSINDRDGGGGSTVRSILTNAQLLNQIITIGAGGRRRLDNYNPALVGGDTSIGSILVAKGGNNANGGSQGGDVGQQSLPSTQGMNNGAATAILSMPVGEFDLKPGHNGAAPTRYGEPGHGSSATATDGFRGRLLINYLP